MKSHVEELIEIATAVYARLITNSMSDPQARLPVEQGKRAAESAVQAAKYLIEEIDKDSRDTE